MVDVRMRRRIETRIATRRIRGSVVDSGVGVRRGRRAADRRAAGRPSATRVFTEFLATGRLFSKPICARNAARIRERAEKRAHGLSVVARARRAAPVRARVAARPVRLLEIHSPNAGTRALRFARGLRDDHGGASFGAREPLPRFRFPRFRPPPWNTPPARPPSAPSPCPPPRSPRRTARARTWACTSPRRARIASGTSSHMPPHHRHGNDARALWNPSSPRARGTSRSAGASSPPVEVEHGVSLHLLLQRVPRRDREEREGTSAGARARRRWSGQKSQACFFLALGRRPSV